LIKLRLAAQSSILFLTTPLDRKDQPQLSREGVETLCARNDAPAWIIAPLKQGTEPPADIPMTLWKLLEPQYCLAKDHESYIWEEIGAYGIIPCAKRQISWPLMPPLRRFAITLR
jgi:hypothetical protein